MDTQQGHFIRLLSFFENEESGLKSENTSMATNLHLDSVAAGGKQGLWSSIVHTSRFKLHPINGILTLRLNLLNNSVTNGGMNGHCHSNPTFNIHVQMKSEIGNNYYKTSIDTNIHNISSKQSCQGCNLR
jgi:hypothetical protein